MKNETKVVVSCGACVYRIVDGRFQVLLVRPFKDRDSWGIPKGHLNEGEEVDACALREVKEETGIDVTLGVPLSVVSARYRNEKKDVKSFLAVQSCDTTAFPADGENVDVRWFDIDELPTVHIYQQKLIKEVKNLLVAMHELKQPAPDSTIPEEIVEALKSVFDYAGHVDDFLIIKKELVKTVKPAFRGLFSVRSRDSYKQQTNDMERELGQIWSTMTGRTVVMPEVHVDDEPT